jgi:transposase
VHLRLWLKVLVHHAALTAHHEDRLAEDLPGEAHGLFRNARHYPAGRRAGVSFVARRISMSTGIPLDRIGVGIDTARYGHRVSFLRPDRQPAAKPMTVLESRAGYQALQERLEKLHEQHPQAHFHIRIDAAGQYATNLEHFLRGLKLPITLSIGEPKRNKDYQKAHFPKRTTDDTESQAMARFAVVELPAASMPVTPAMTILREVAGRLQAKVKQSTQAINRLHNLLARTFPELANLTDDITAAWVLHLLDKYPTAQRIGQAHLATLQKIPYVAPELAKQLHLVAQQSVASLSGAVAEALVRDLAAQVRHTQRAEEQMRRLLTDAYADLPASAHLQAVTVPGIGVATAAAIIAQAVDINRFATPEHFVGYFGVFPEENTSGVDKYGHPVPPGTMRMSRKGNDLVRHYLWNAARSAIRHNPAIGALYRRLRAKGKRGDTAMGQCMRKMLHLVYAVWKTNRPFDEKHFAWEPPAPAAQTATPPTAAGAAHETKPSVANVSSPAAAQEKPVHENPASATPAPNDKSAVGHKRDSPAEEVVTTANATVGPTTPTVKPAPAANRAARPKVDFAFLREQVTMEQVLSHLGLLDKLRGRGLQRRGPCPLHGGPNNTQPTFSAHLGKHIFQCFQAECRAQGNALDLWAAVHNLPLYEAALHLAETFHLRRNREEEPVLGTR